jgi:acetoin utilization deacetylase AcuC-like enzyme
VGKPALGKSVPMTTAFLTHSACLAHEVPEGHPESPSRLRAVIAASEAEEFAHLWREEAPRASLGDLTAVHGRAYVEALLEAVPREGFKLIDADTALSPGSGEAALRAAGAVIRAVDLVAEGTVRNAFCAVRPPGHHAEPEQAMGFCLFNNIAIGALHARAAHGARRLAVVDFDVHHGNGTQAVAYDDPDFFYASTHQFPLYPGTGAPSERGIAENIVNVPLRSGSGSEAFRRALTDEVLPRLEAFAPDFLLVSAGFDAHASDPLGGLALSAADFGWATAALCAVAARCAKGRLVSALEGGYDLDALSRSAAAHLRALVEG